MWSGAGRAVGGGSTGSRGGGGPPSSCSVNGSRGASSVFTELPCTDTELCRRIGAGDSGRWEDVDCFGCSSSSPSASPIARSLPFPLLGVTEAEAVRPPSVAPRDKAREIRLQLFLEGEASGRAVELWVVLKESLDFPTRPIMLLRIVDLRERFGRSDDATAASSRDGVEAVGRWVDGPALEGELEASEAFCFDVVCPISIRVSVDTDSIYLWCGGRDAGGGEGEKESMIQMKNVRRVYVVVKGEGKDGKTARTLPGSQWDGRRARVFAQRRDESYRHMHTVTRDS